MTVINVVSKLFFSYNLHITHSFFQCFIAPSILASLSPLSSLCHPSLPSLLPSSLPPLPPFCPSLPLSYSPTSPSLCLCHPLTSLPLFLLPETLKGLFSSTASMSSSLRDLRLLRIDTLLNCCWRESRPHTWERGT